MNINEFHMPTEREIPNVGLYLEQVTKYVADCYEPLGGVTITSNMISNYVKKKLIKNPVKKQYDREQIADILFVAFAKTVLSLEEIQKLFDIQHEHYSWEKAYSYFCEELNNVIAYVFGAKEQLDPVTAGGESPVGKELLRNVIMAAAYKAYLDESFAKLN